MRSEEFNKVLADQLRVCAEVLRGKAAEYATDEDRLHNFKVVAALQGISIQEAVVGLMAKHTVSVFDLARSKDRVSMDMWNEKITDHMNYLILLKAAVVEDEKKWATGAVSANPEDLEAHRLRVESVLRESRGQN